MKYIVKNKHKSHFGGSMISRVLANRGIEDEVLFMYPNRSSDTDIDMVKNLRKGADIILEAIKNKLSMLLVVDSDCDGFTSSAAMYKMIKALDKEANINFKLHTLKKHGLTDEIMEHIRANHYDLIIIPDAGSNDVKEIEEIVLVHKAKVVVIDHHEVEKVSEYGVIINNQICQDTNNNLTGVGMVLLMCKMIEREYNTGIYQELLNLAAVGQIGDSSNLTDNEVRNMCFEGLRKIDNKFMQTFYEVNGKDIGKLTIKDLSFAGVIPAINAVIRVGEIEEKYNLFEALIDYDMDYKVTVSKRKLNKETRKYDVVDIEMTGYEYIVDMCQKARNKQQSIVKKAMKEADELVIKTNGVQVITLKNEYEGMSGMIAMKLVEKYQAPTIVLSEFDDVYKGSLRGLDGGNIASFKDWCLETNLFKLVQGHANAAGVEIKKENIEALKGVAAGVDKISQVIKEVDFEFTTLSGAKSYGEEIADHKHLWSKGCEEPLFAFKDLVISKTNIQYTKNTVRININGITFIKRHVSEGEYNEMFMSGFGVDVKINCIGTFAYNEWNEKKYIQFLISDWEQSNEENIYGVFC